MIEYQYRVVMGEQTRTIERLDRTITELRQRIEELETGIRQHRTNKDGRYVETCRLWSLIDGDGNR